MSKPNHVTFRVDPDNFDSIQELLNFLEKSDILDSEIPTDEENPGPFGGILTQEKNFYQKEHSTDTFYLYLEAPEDEETLSLGTALVNVGTIYGYYFGNFIATEEYFNEVCKALGLSYDEESYQIYLINKELMNGN